MDRQCAVVSRRRFVLTVGVVVVTFSYVGAFSPADPDTITAFYPLTIGNYWEYYEYAGFGGGIVDTVSRRVTGDTTIGSHTYATIEFRSPRYNQVSNSFERVDSIGDVYSYHFDGDLLEYRISDTSATPWEYGGAFRRWDRNNVDTTFGGERRALVALTYQPLDTLGVFGSGTGILQGIGLTFSLSTEGGGEVFRGARIEGVVYGTVTSVDQKKAGMPDDYELHQNYPNPFNPSTTIEYTTPRAGKVTVKVYDALGRQVDVLIDEWKPPGRYAVKWEADHIAGGIYFCTMHAGAHNRTVKMVMIK